MKNIYIEKMPDNISHQAVTDSNHKKIFYINSLGKRDTS